MKPSFLQVTFNINSSKTNAKVCTQSGIYFKEFSTIWRFCFLKQSPELAHVEVYERVEGCHPSQSGSTTVFIKSPRDFSPWNLEKSSESHNQKIYLSLSKFLKLTSPFAHFCLFSSKPTLFFFLLKFLIIDVSFGSFLPHFHWSTKRCQAQSKN